MAANVVLLLLEQNVKTETVYGHQDTDRLCDGDGGLGVTYDDHLRLIGKRVVDSLPISVN